MSARELLFNQRETARALGISVQAFQAWNVQPARRKGREALYDLSIVIALWRAKILREAEPQRLNLEHERARLARAQSEKTELEVARIRGTQIDIDAITAAVAKLLGDARVRFLALPSSAAPLVARCKGVAQVKEEIERHVYDALRDLASTDPVDFVRALNLPTVESAAQADDEPVGGRASHRQPRNKRKPRKVANG